LAIGFAGVIVYLRPGWGLFQPVALVAVAAGLFSALAQVNIRYLTNREPVIKIVFYFALISTAMSAFRLPFVWVPPTFSVWVALVSLGAIATVAQILLTNAFGSAPASRVGPFVYAAVVFGGVWDWLFWKQLPDLWFMAGAFLIAAAGFLMLRYGGTVPKEEIG
jgi:drug/metabolite transporter (DMT)-like permease